MANINKVPVMEVHSDNLPLLWSTITNAIKSATFIAVDTELSGLGDRGRLNAKDITERYISVSEVSRTRSILSLGLSCFKIVQRADGESASANTSPTQRSNITLDVETFNVFVLCTENYVVEPVSLKFLVNHGFDFNKQYAKGLPYHRGNDKPGPRVGPIPSVRQLYTELLLSGKPLVLHNALVDLIYLYQSFYAELPSTLTTFLADLAEVYRGGVYDTKYLTEFKARLGASYLEYVFRKSQRDNCSGADKGWGHVRLNFEGCDAWPTGHRVVMPCALDDQPPATDAEKTAICQHYASHGWCAAAAKCPKSHDVDRILDSEQQTAARKRRKRRRYCTDSDEASNTVGAGEMDGVDTSPSDGVTNNPRLRGNSDTVEILGDEPAHVSRLREKSSGEDASQGGRRETRTGGHRAGFDAFMTGYIFAFFMARFGKIHLLPETPTLDDFRMAEFANKVYLGGKDIPLQITKSAFAKTSKEHRNKQDSLQRAAKYLVQVSDSR